MPTLFLTLFLLLTAAPAIANTDTGPSPWRPHQTQSGDGVIIHYYVAGDLNAGTTPLLVISGGPGSDHRYLRVGGAFEKISKHRPVVMFDQRGSGVAIDDEANWDFDLWASDVEAVRLALEAERIDLLGHSFGGLVAMSYAEQYPETLRSITFAGSSAPKLSDTRQLMADIYPDRFADWMAKRRTLTPRFAASELSLFFSMEFVDPDKAVAYEKAVSDYVYRIDLNNELRAQLTEKDYTETVSSLNIPVLIVHGRFDAIIAPSVAWSLHEMIEGSQIKFIEQAGHLAFAEAPEAFAAAVESMLDALDGAEAH